MTYFSNYDSWKLDNGEKSCTCDKCETLVKSDSDMIECMGQYELICTSCAEDMMWCDNCGKCGNDESFSYGQENCDNCCDIKADKMSDMD